MRVRSVLVLILALVLGRGAAADEDFARRIATWQEAIQKRFVIAIGLRKRAGAYNSVQLAQESGVTPTTAHYWGTGARVPTLENAFVAAKSLRVPPKWLMSFDYLRAALGEAGVEDPRIIALPSRVRRTVLYALENDFDFAPDFAASLSEARERTATPLEELVRRWRDVIARRLQAELLRHGIVGEDARADLAQALGVEVRMLDRWIAGTSVPCVDRARRIARRFGTELGYVLAFEFLQAGFRSLAPADRVLDALPAQVLSTVRYAVARGFVVPESPALCARGLGEVVRLVPQSTEGPSTTAERPISSAMSRSSRK